MHGSKMMTYQTNNMTTIDNPVIIDKGPKRYLSTNGWMNFGKISNLLQCIVVLSFRLLISYANSAVYDDDPDILLISVIR